MVFSSSLHLLLKDFLPLPMNRFCSASGKTKAFNSANEIIGIFGLLETLDDGSPKVILPFISLQIPQLSEALVSHLSMLSCLLPRIVARLK